MAVVAICQLSHSNTFHPAVCFFLAYLELKLWLKKQKLGEYSSTTKGNVGNFG